MKKIFYSAAIAVTALGLVACGGKKSEDVENAEMAEATADTDDSYAYAVEEYTSEDVYANTEDAEETADEEDSDSNAPSGSNLINDKELSTFKSNFKTGDTDKMLEAFAWYVKTKTAIRPGVRSLNEDAIKAEIALDKAVDEVVSPYDKYSLSAVFWDMTDKMTAKQKETFNKLDSEEPLYFTANDDITEHSALYRKLRYGSPF